MHPVPAAEHARSLRLRRDELEQHLQRCRDAAAKRSRPNPSLGREVDDVRALLAKVRTELTWLERP